MADDGQHKESAESASEEPRAQVSAQNAPEEPRAQVDDRGVAAESQAHTSAEDASKEPHAQASASEAEASKKASGASERSIEDLPPLQQAAARRAEAAKGGMFDVSHTSDKQPAAPVSKRQKIIRVVVVAAALALGALVLATSGSGQLNVSVMSDSGAADGYDVDVALYSGDVTGVLTDDDPSNDPEPLETHRIPVGQRTTFNVQGFGEHTLDVTFAEDAPVGNPDPVTVSMFGIDMRSTVTTA